MKQQLSNLQRSKELAIREEMVVIPTGTYFMVYTDKGTEYGVVTDEVGGKNKIVNCSCPHRQHRGAVCKHMVKVSMEQGLPIYLG